VSTQRACDVCHMYRQRADGTPAVMRYSLKRDVVDYRQNHNRFGRKQISCGGIDLCDECWQRIGQPRQNPRKSHPRAA
jgi:hypothetical protein